MMDSLRVWAVGTLFLSLFGSLSFAASPATVAQQDENLQLELLQNLQTSEDFVLNPALLATSCSENSGRCHNALAIAIQTLDEQSHSRNLSMRSRVQTAARYLYRHIRHQPQHLGEALQLYVLFHQASGGPDTAWEAELKTQLQHVEKQNQINDKTLLTLLSYPEIFEGWRAQPDKNIDKRTQALLDVASTFTDNTAQARDLINIEPEIEKYYSGNYKNTPRLYMFCRANREFPCLMLMKNNDGSLHVSPKTKRIWTQPSLGYSRHKKPYNQSNGNTPSGVFRIDGVMPDNDKQMVYGKFRRLILNFVGKTENETNYKYLLPPSSHEATWWLEATVARDIGRGLFRIHGTGLYSSDQRNYFPFVPTSGCVAKRENTYDSVTFKDQRELLDELMLAMDMAPKNDNETRLRGLLYVINLNSERRAVTIEDLVQSGIVKY